VQHGTVHKALFQTLSHKFLFLSVRSNSPQQMSHTAASNKFMSSALFLLTLITPFFIKQPSCGTGKNINGTTWITQKSGILYLVVRNKEHRDYAIKLSCVPHTQISVTD
jgi:hypothetical protein